MSVARTIALVAPLALPLVAPAQDVGAGKTAFAQQCGACHATDGRNGLGPSLKGVTGRTAGTLDGFHYSAAMKGFARPWDGAALDAFLASPQKAVPGNAMPFPGIADAKQRADLVAYLASLK